MPLIKSPFAGFVRALPLALSVGLPGSAFAQAQLISATPAINSMAIPPPTEIRLKFSEVVEPKFARVRVTGPGKKVIQTGKATLDPSDRTQLIVPLKSPLPDGTYTIDWQAISAYGHQVRGSYGFESMQQWPSQDSLPESSDSG
jgi:methionine-rich copper-binding protein CopC